ncbi:MAG: hypothetical protein J0647_05530 [Campylobacteraceae bacterium]|nr:hypothetical protein [Campylobacteraceae bacterium]
MRDNSNAKTSAMPVHITLPILNEHISNELLNESVSKVLIPKNPSTRVGGKNKAPSLESLSKLFCLFFSFFKSDKAWSSDISLFRSLISLSIFKIAIAFSFLYLALLK